jgi:hypothetical protein
MTRKQKIDQFIVGLLLGWVFGLVIGYQAFQYYLMMHP